MGKTVIFHGGAAPKKGKKLALNDFLADDTLGSWADEMDSLPTARMFRAGGGGGDFHRDRDFPPRGQLPPREELPLPTKPPYIAFVGNLAFDIYEELIAEFFVPNVLKDIKIIKDRDEKPKGFGYVEFETLDGLKDGLSRTGGQMMNRTIRISVAEPPKERGGFDDDRFAGPWRREGPLPPLPSSSSRSHTTERSGFGSGFSSRPSVEAEGAAPHLAELNNDWRSNRPTRPPPSERSPPPPRRPSGPPDGPPHPAHVEQTWTIGSKFKPSVPAETVPERRTLFGGRRGDTPAGAGESPEEISDWRATPRRTVSHTGSTRGSPTTSTPPTPQLGGRRKLELLPRGMVTPSGESPLSSPKSTAASSAKPNPFGAAKPIDAAAREKEVEERLEQERQVRAAKEKEHEASRSTSGFSRPTPASRSEPGSPHSGRPTSGSAAATPSSPASVSVSSTIPAPSAKFSSSTGVIRPQISFAAAAAASKTGNGTEAPAAAANDQTSGNIKELENLGPSVEGAAVPSAVEVEKLSEQVAEAVL
ncbi:hypothetical protein BS47DRAFT_1371539 [Hydnum rufescens UP504]|uniref:RRM domain-containing protein n=1 Tax=Hydnum rufescens UP504 TaxID=1448309 RepID=A0A9P6B4R0_9AGAM|nr:hypothetical protein BS47DRAFT_1371539 [Hydnum rufescens UP504]